ncbi:MAG: hypothetical protein WCO42_04015 [bacterium]
MGNETNSTTLLVDGHVHIYPNYAWPTALKSLLENLTRFTEQKPCCSVVGLLTESKSCQFYKEVIEKGAPLTLDSLQVAAGPDVGSLVIRENGRIRGYLIAGRQIVTRENLEFLALGADLVIPDGLPAIETLQAITEQGAVPVLSWSPGKWFFGRGKLVKTLISSNLPDSFLIGDTGLRPMVWGLPRLMGMANQRGYRIIGGSDSLPLSGEERWLGSYGFQITSAFDPQQPAASLRRILQSPESRFVPIGGRNAVSAFAARWGRNQLRKHVFA